MGDLHGPQSGISTGPALPLAPAWMCAAVALPLRWSKLRFHDRATPLSSPLNFPDARVGAPSGRGVSCLVSRLVLNFSGRLSLDARATAVIARMPTATSAGT